LLYEPVEVTLHRKRRALLVAITIVLVAACVVIGVGGLGLRPTMAITVQPGDEIDQGMMIFTVSSATASYREFDSSWQVVVTGKVRNPNSESLAPTDSFFGSVIGVDKATDQYVNNVLYCLGTPMGTSFSSDRKFVLPDSEWMDIQLLFEMQEPYTPSDTFRIAFRPMSYRVLIVLGLSPSKVWAPEPAAQNFVVNVPLTQLPDQ